MQMQILFVLCAEFRFAVDKFSQMCYNISNALRAYL